MAVNYKEFIDDRSPSQIGFSLEGGRAVMSFVCDPEDLEDSLKDVLGGVEAGEGAALKRILPRAHPQFPWLFADAITGIVGLRPNADIEADPTLEAEPVSTYVEYTKYIFTVTFSPRPYAVLSDDAITEGTLNYTDPYGDSQTKTYANEWVRFTDWFFEPKLEIIEGLQGGLKIRGNTGVLPDGITAHATPTIRVPKPIIKVVWYYVPYSYVFHADSRILTFLGRINLNEFEGYPAGSLLYSGCGITRHTPIFPKIEPGINGFSVPVTDKLCTVEFYFEYAPREMAPGITPTAPASTNYIQAGHNLLPWFGNRQFYYVSTTDNVNDTDNAKRYPIFFAEPFELLFSNPAV